MNTGLTKKVKAKKVNKNNRNKKFNKNSKKSHQNIRIKKHKNKGKISKKQKGGVNKNIEPTRKLQDELRFKDMIDQKVGPLDMGSKWPGKPPTPDCSIM